MFNYPVIDMTATGVNIAVMREQAGLSVRDLQQIFGFSTPQAIYKWQHGACLPTLDNIAVLSAVLHVPIEKILIYKNSP